MFNSRSGTPETEVDVSNEVILGLFSLYGGVCAFYHYPKKRKEKKKSGTNKLHVLPRTPTYSANNPENTPFRTTIFAFEVPDSTSNVIF